MNPELLTLQRNAVALMLAHLESDADALATLIQTTPRRQLEELAAFLAIYASKLTAELTGQKSAEVGLVMRETALLLAAL